MTAAIDCYNDLCRSHYMECDLPCSAYIKCLDACDCADRRCVASCEPTPECATCRNDNVRCDRQMTCAMLLPACAFEQRERSCAELETCCPDLRGTAKGVCQDAVQADDAAQCSLYYGAYCEQPG